MFLSNCEVTRYPLFKLSSSARLGELFSPLATIDSADVVPCFQVKREEVRLTALDLFTFRVSDESSSRPLLRRRLCSAHDRRDMVDLGLPFECSGPTSDQTGI